MVQTWLLIGGLTLYFDRHMCVPTQQASQAHGEMAVLMHCVVWVGSQVQGNLAVDTQR